MVIAAVVALVALIFIFVRPPTVAVVLLMFLACCVELQALQATLSVARCVRSSKRPANVDTSSQCVMVGGW